MNSNRGNHHNSADDLINPSGRPLLPQPKLVILKHTADNPIDPRQIAAIAGLLKCPVLELPMDSEFMMDKVAAEEMKSIHKAIHAIMKIPEDAV